MPNYCPEFKRSCAEKVIQNEFKSVDQIASENGVSRATLFRWVKLFGAESAGVIKRKVRPQDWSMASKLKALLETQSMSERELGEFLRTRGLHYSHLLEWKSEVLDEVKKRGKKVPDNEAVLLRRIRELERELKIKDKALKEATALAILKKKAELLWGEAEEEKSKEKPAGKSSRSSKKPKKTEQE